ncbi:MAG: non-ribosomal peptide synthetase, partial [Streptomyces sp.]
VDEALAEATPAAAGQQAWRGPPPMRAARPGEPVPATYGQRGLWFHDALHPGSTVYNEPLTLRLRGPLDAGALAGAVATIVERHEALRTDLVMSDGELRQEVRPATPPELTVQDLRTVPAPERAGAVERAVRQAVREPFDPATGPHLRSRLLRCGDEEHLLVLSLHHSVFDGGSADILFDELSALYTANTEQRDAGLDPPPSQYADFALWQHALIAGGHAEEDLAYWREALTGLPETMDLPTDFPRPETPSGDGALVRGRLPRELTERVDALAHATGATPYNAFLAAFHLLLSRYCGTDDVVVGAPFSGRDQPGTARSVGYYLNTLPLRADLGGAPTFRQLLARTRQTVTDAYTHQRVPYGLVVADASGAGGEGGAGGASGAAENPYLQVCLVPEDIYRHRMTFAGVESTFEYYDTGIAKFDLTVNLIPDAEGEGGLRLTAEYRTDLFRAATVERLLGHFRTLLESAAAEPDVPVTELPMLTGAEQARILTAFASFGGEASFGGDAFLGEHEGAFEAEEAVPDRGVHELVDRWTVRTPDAPALVTDGEELSYRELVRRADQLAHYLAERGAEPGSRIGVCLPRGTDAVVAFLAVLKTGGAYVPLDPAYPEQRLSFMAEDAGLLLSLTPDLLHDDREAIGDSPARAPAVAVTGEDIAYVIYTSGSTGQPKGVRIPHRAVADLALGAPGWAGIDPGTRLLLVASLSFDMVTFDIWGTLVNGARLVLAPEGTVTAGQIASLITRHGITHGDMPTALLHRQAEEDPSSLAGLRTLIAGGEVLNPALATAVLEANPGLRLINGYGPTEATTYATHHVLTGPDQVTEPVPIGRPVPGTRARILDAARQPVPVGVVGELHLGGPGLADGYLDRPELTAACFTEDPFGDGHGELLYGTGDLARWRPDGAIDYVGRVDGQLKLYGYRVEPGDIEAALRTHPDVAHAVVTRREDRPGSPYLAAYYTSTRGDEIPARELTEVAAARLPAYMVPRVFTALERFPVTEGGKTDRAALPAPAVVQAQARAQRRAPEGAPEEGPPEEGAESLASVQEQIGAIWRDVVTLDTLGPDERLFDIGGASLHVTLIHQRVAERFGLSGLRMIDLFSHPTLSTYAAHVHELYVREKAGEPR